MKRRRTIILCICALLVCIFAGILTACGAEEDFEGVQVVYEFEGGTYKNGVRATHYYNLEPGTECLLVAPESVYQNELRRPGYTFVGWYRTKTVDSEGNITYSNPWDFEKDTITSDTERLTLYAEWKDNFRTYYELCYRDEDGNDVSIARYNVSNNGAKFDNTAKYISVDEEDKVVLVGAIPDTDAANAANAVGCSVRKECVNGKSCVVYFDKAGDPWDPDYIHPGDEGDDVEVKVTTDPETGEVLSKECTVKVFVEFEEGIFTHVSNKDELTRAIAYKENIELLADIDFAGGKFNGFADSTTRTCGGLKNFNGSAKELYIDGRNHAIKNFELGYNNLVVVEDNALLGKGSLIVSLFGMIDNVRIENVSFTDVTINLSAQSRNIVNIYVAPLVLTAVNSTINNVSFTGTYKVTDLPENFKNGNLEVELDRTNPVHFPVTDDTKIGNDVTVTLSDAPAEENGQDA